jgi:tRNA(fMet)-specific endonuclease VapC
VFRVQSYGLFTIGENDLLIAAQGMAQHLVLVTDNERDFARVDGLNCESRLR